MVFNKTSNGTQLESIAWDGGRIVSRSDYEPYGAHILIVYP